MTTTLEPLIDKATGQSWYDFRVEYAASDYAKLETIRGDWQALLEKWKATRLSCPDAQKALDLLIEAAVEAIDPVMADDISPMARLAEEAVRDAEEGR